MNKLIIILQYLINIMGCLPFIHVSSQEISDNSIQPANQTNNTSTNALVLKSLCGFNIF